MFDIASYIVSNALQVIVKCANLQIEKVKTNKL